MATEDSSEFVFCIARRILVLIQESGATQLEASIGLHVAKRLLLVSGMSLATPGRVDEERRLDRERNARRGSSGCG
jgi:hypothetical protein